LEVVVGLQQTQVVRQAAAAAALVGKIISQ
jgi:hypothetical protein